jgi:hypothetical protein
MQQNLTANDVLTSLLQVKLTQSLASFHKSAGYNLYSFSETHLENLQIRIHATNFFPDPIQV